MKLKGVIDNNESQIPKAIYEKESVTHSEMDFDRETTFEISTITLKEIDIKEISKISNKEFLEDKNKNFRKWFFLKYDKLSLDTFKNDYYEYIKITEEYMSFVN